MQEQVNRKDADADHIARCQAKLNILLEQKTDMQFCFDELMDDLQKGIRKMKVYRQMKMYNDTSLNPVLYASKKG
jgi:ribosome-associated translation inhibitor RaiA